MRILCRLVGYKLKLLISDRMLLSCMIFLPVLITFVIGYALHYEKLSFIPISVVDLDNSSHSCLLCERLSNKQGFLMFRQDKEKALQDLHGNRVEIVIMIRKGFGEKIKRGDTNEIIEIDSSPASVSVGFVSEVLSGELMRLYSNEYALSEIGKELGKNQRVLTKENEKEVLAYMESLWNPKPILTIQYQQGQGNFTTSVKPPILERATATSVGMIVLFLLMLLLFQSGWLIEERVNGTLKRICSIQNGLGYVFFSNIIAFFLLGILHILLFYGLVKFVFGVELFLSVWSYLILIAYLLAIIALSMLLSSLVKTPERMQALAPLLAILSSFVGGCFWNGIEIGGTIQGAALYTLQGWALQGINLTLLPQFENTQAWQPLLVLLVFSAICLAVSYKLIVRKTLI